jgi:hypothetical protein
MSIDGYKARTTSKGYRVIELDVWAHPDRGPAWIEEARRSASSPAEFERNVMRNWNITSGTTYYPEFAEIGRHRYEYEPPALLAGPVIRGWDFGYRAPCCIWLQYVPASDRVYVLREFSPKGIGSHDFRDVVRHLSGQLHFEELRPTAQEWVTMLRELPGMPKPPWFPEGTQFVDLAGPEVNRVQSIAANDPAEATERLIFAAGGIEFAIQAGRVKARTKVLRRLLHLRPDGWPGIVISPYCVDVLAMLDGGLTFLKATTKNPMPEEPKKDGRHDNTNDALTYALVGMVPADGVPGVTPGMAAQPADDSIAWSLGELR